MTQNSTTLARLLSSALLVSAIGAPLTAHAAAKKFKVFLSMS